jgi:two-component system sensor histidine kinase TctE
VDLAAVAIETVQDFVPKALDKRIDLGYEGPGVDSSDDGPSPAAEPDLFDGPDLALRKEVTALHGPPAPPRPAPRVLGQPILLRELIRNLVDNALQYTPAGGTVTVRLVADPFGQVVVLQVEDSGPGIPPAEREKVFHPFYRTLGTEVDGSGLGLAIVREIAQQHAAEVTLEDANLRHRSGLAEQGVAAYGPGARFTVRFAAWQPTAEVARQVDERGVPAGVDSSLSAASRASWPLT